MELKKRDNSFYFMLTLALPVLAEETLNLLVGYTDWWLTGRYLPGTHYKAAMGLVAYTTWILPNLFAAAAIGGTALVARFVGANDKEKAAKTANQALLAGTVLAAVVTSLVWFFGGWFVRALQLQGESAELAERYLAIVTPAIPAIMIEQVASACLRGAGDAISGFVAKTIVNIVNVTLSASLVLGLGPFPELGWDGLAIGTACGHGVGGLILLTLLLRGRAGLRLRASLLVPDRDLLKRLVRIGVPGGADVLTILSCHMVYVAIINQLGTEAAAAHGLGVQIEALAYLPGSAFSVAASTMAGQYLGANDPRLATRGSLNACLAGMVVMTAAGLAFFFAGHALATFFTGDWQDPTGMMTGDLLKIVALSMPSLAVTMILAGALRGAGDTAWPLAISLIGLLTVRLPGAYLLANETVTLPLIGEISGFGLGVAGAWWAMVADVVLRGFLMGFRFWHGGWRKTKV